MELEDLRAYLAVVEHKGFRRAAEVLYVSQPALTRRIARLEQELGVHLLERTHTGVKVTPQGDTLLSGARRVLTAVEDARAATTQSWSQTITVASTPVAAGTFLTDFLGTWLPRHAHVRVRMIEDIPRRTRQRLVDLECDAALAASPLPPEADGLPITRVEVRALIPAGHELAVDGPLRVTDLADHPLLISGEEFRSTRMLRAACQLAGITPNVIFECSVGHTIETLVLAGVGIGVLSGAVNRERLPGIHLRPLCDANGTVLTFDMNVAWIRGRPVNPALRAFIRDLSDFTEPLRAGPDLHGPAQSDAEGAP